MLTKSETAPFKLVIRKKRDGGPIPYGNDSDLIYKNLSQHLKQNLKIPISLADTPLFINGYKKRPDRSRGAVKGLIQVYLT